MRKLMLLILLGVTVVAFGQGILPEWSQIVPGIWAHLQVQLNDGGQEPTMMAIASWAGTVQVDNERRLLQALKEIRAQNPDQFDAVFRSYGLAIDTR